MLAPLLTCNPTSGHHSPDAAAACFAAAVAILASVGRSAAAGANSSHLDERLAEAALCAISIAVTVSEAPSTLTVHFRAPLARGAPPSVQPPSDLKRVF